jgi:hypothetical protein
MIDNSVFATRAALPATLSRPLEHRPMNIDRDRNENSFLYKDCTGTRTLCSYLYKSPLKLPWVIRPEHSDDNTRITFLSTEVIPLRIALFPVERRAFKLGLQRSRPRIEIGSG